MVTNLWKQKAVERNKKIKALNKRLIELENSRDNWKIKATNFKKELNEEKKKI